MNIIIYSNASDPEYMDKSITEITTLSGTLRTEQTEVIDPVIVIEDPDNILGASEANYARIAAFERYYYIRKKRSIRNGIIEISLHVDVLMSFKNAIKARRAITRRQEHNWNLYINDGSLITYENDLYYTKVFNTGFEDVSRILVVAG